MSDVFVRSLTLNDLMGCHHNMVSLTMYVQHVHSKLTQFGHQFSCWCTFISMDYTMQLCKTCYGFYHIQGFIEDPVTKTGLAVPQTPHLD